MKKNIVIFSIIMLILTFIGGITYYKFFLQTNHETVEYERPKQEYTYDTNYIKLYSNNIINEKKTVYDFKLEIADQLLEGCVYIDKDGNLYILDKSDNTKNLLFEEKKFMTLYSANDEIINVMVLYALSEDGNLYLISLRSKNIIDVTINELEIPSTVKNFTNLTLNRYDDLAYTSVVVYSENGKMYDAFSGIEYSEKVLNVMNEYLIFDDSAISDIFGEMIIDSNGDIVKVDDIIIPMLDENFTFPGIPSVMFITKDKKLTYLYEDKKIYRDDKIIKEVKQDDYFINITYEDNSTLKFIGKLDELK